MKHAIAISAISLMLASTAWAGNGGNGNPGAGFIEEWDTNGDGQVTAEDVASRRADIFMSFDYDDDGILTAEEYLAFDETRDTAHDGEDQGNQGHGGERKAAVGMTLEFNDVDGDGAVSLEEFTGQSAAWLALVDRDGDGIVTTADFGPARG